MVAIYLKERGHKVLGFARKPSKYVDSITGDAFDTTLLSDIIEKGDFDAVINCIGILNQFAEQDKKTAVFLNAYLPHFLADVTKSLKTKIIHISTDCVFSGKKGGYTERDFKDGESFYDRTKALGELDDNKNVTLRTSIIGPDLNPNGIGLLNWFLNSEGKVNGYLRAIWTGQTTLQLAKTIEAATEKNATGLINAVPEKSINKYELLCLFNEYFRNGSVTVNAVEGVILDKSLKRTNFDFDYKIPDYREMIAELFSWTLAHKDMYPHYHL